MPKLIKNCRIVDDHWQLVESTIENETTSQLEKYSIVSVALWPQQKDKHNALELGIWLNTNDSLQAISADLDRLPVIAIKFSVFTDGRGYSLARQLRANYGYSGEIRAVGDVLLDQLFYMQRCGFNSFQLRETSQYAIALNYLDTFKQVYQSAADNKMSILQQRLNAQ